MTNPVNSNDNGQFVDLDPALALAMRQYVATHAGQTIELAQVRRDLSAMTRTPIASAAFDVRLAAATGARIEPVSISPTRSRLCLICPPAPEAK